MIVHVTINGTKGKRCDAGHVPDHLLGPSELGNNLKENKKWHGKAMLKLICPLVRVVNAVRVLVWIEISWAFMHSERTIPGLETTPDPTTKKVALTPE
jgi:hypothetical protein